MPIKWNYRERYYRNILIGKTDCHCKFVRALIEWWTHRYKWEDAWRNRRK